MILQDTRGSVQGSTVQTEDTCQLRDELYTIKEVATMFKTSKQQIWKLFKRYDIGTINIASVENVKRQTFRVKRDEILKLRKSLKI